MIKIKHAIAAVLPLLLISLVFFGGCGDAPPDLPAPVMNVGSVRIGSSLMTSSTETVEPDSMMVIINDENQGNFANPCQIDGLYTGAYRIATQFDVEGVAFTTPASNVRVEFDEVAELTFDLRVGSIIIASPVELVPGSPVYPDSIGIILDGETLEGYHSNPDTLELILEGDHIISTFAEYEGEEFLGMDQTVNVSLGQVSPLEIPMSSGGVLVISGVYNSEDLLNFGVILDGEDLDLGDAPRIITNVSAGTHRLTAYSTDDTSRVEGWASEIAVALAETTTVDVTLQVVAPFEGVHAPSFVAEDIYGNEYCLADHFEQDIVFMYFFSNT